MKKVKKVRGFLDTGGLGAFEIESYGESVLDISISDGYNNNVFLSEKALLKVVKGLETFKKRNA